MRTAGGTPVPGAAVRLLEIVTGHAWLTWTDENGKFIFPALPAGRYRVEVSQLGFDTLTKEIDLGPAAAGQAPAGPGQAAASTAPIELRLVVATLAELNAAPAAAPATAATLANPAPPATPSSAAPASPQTPAQNPSAANPTPANSASNAPGNLPQNQSAANTPAQGNARRGNPSASPAAGGAPGRAGAGGQRRGFQQVGLNGQAQGGANGNEADTSTDANASTQQESRLGQASSSDSFMMNGTVAMGAGGPDMFGAGQGGFGPGGQDNGEMNAATGGEGGQGLQGGGPGGGGPGGPGGFGGPGGGGPGGPGGFGGPGGGGGPGGPGGFGGPGGGGGFGGPGGRGGRGQQGGGAQGVGALWGVQRVMRQRINRMHFSMYDGYSNAALNAAPYPLTGVSFAKPQSWQERFGGNMGGPLRIPHVYDGRDKTFIFINVESQWNRNAVDQFSTVPTEAERDGNFSGVTYPNSTAAVQLYCPATPVIANCPAGTALGSQLVSPTTGASLVNPAAAALLLYVPMPNLPGTTRNFRFETVVPANSELFNIRLIQTISPKINLTAGYSLNDSHSHSFNSFPALEGNSDSLGQSVTLGLTENLTKTLIHTSTLYFTRSRSQSANLFTDVNDAAATLGISGVSTNPMDYGLPAIGLANFTGITTPTPSLTRDQTWRYVDSIQIIWPKHTITAGFEMRHVDANTLSDPTPNGSFTFSGSLTSQIGTGGLPVANTGYDLADFLLGLPEATKIQYGTPGTYFRSWGFIGYGQDDWRITPHFTLVYGLRYEGFTPPSELYNHIADLDVNSSFTEVALVLPGQTGPFSGVFPRSLVRGDYDHFSPRLGLAWRPANKWLAGKHGTTFRAGYGIFYNQSIYQQLAREMANQPPFAFAETFQANATNSLTLADGFPSSGSSSSAVTNTVAINPDYKIGYAQIWSISAERQLTATTSLVLTYTGTKGTDLDLLFGIAGATNLNAGASGQTTTVANTQGFTYDTSGANSIYNALQVRVQKRMSKGLMINATYTYGKSLDDASSIGGGAQVIVQDNHNVPGQYGLSSFDIRNQLRLNYFYQLPFGDRQPFFTHGWKRKAFSDIRLSGNITLRSGSPFTVLVAQSQVAAQCDILPGVASERANQSGNPELPSSERTLTEWFNTSVFSSPTGCIGDAPRNSIIGPGSFVWNVGLNREFQFGRDGLRRLDLSWNVQNVTNSPTFSGISTSFGSATFGQVTSAGAMRSMSFLARVNF